jgi:regulatory protein
MGTITALEIQKRNKERVNVYLDGEYTFSLALIEAAKLRKGQPLTDAEIDALRGEDDVTRAVDYAANFLSYRPRSVAEVRRNLEKKDLPEAVIEQAIDRLQQLGYVDDVAFARYWLENRDTFKPRGPAALRYELRQKGVAEDIIGAALESLDPVDAARRAGEAKARRLRGLTREAFRNKLGSFLQRRGFRYETTRDVIHQIIDELVADDPDFFVEDETI